jgi:hypothetical protein
MKASGRGRVIDESGVSRRAFLAATGGLGLSVALAGLPGALARHGWLDEALAAAG